MQLLEALKQELISRGATKAQADSKVVPLVVSVIADKPSIVDLQKADDELQKIKNQTDIQRHVLANVTSYQADLWKAIEKAKIEKSTLLHEAEREAQAYINEFYKALNNCETAEQRDALKTAQIFINSVDVNTKYDNTAYIIGLASILSGKKLDGITELKKINTRLV